MRKSPGCEARVSKNSINMIPNARSIIILVNLELDYKMICIRLSNELILLILPFFVYGLPLFKMFVHHSMCYNVVYKTLSNNILEQLHGKIGY